MNNVNETMEMLNTLINDLQNVAQEKAISERDAHREYLATINDNKRPDGYESPINNISAKEIEIVNALKNAGLTQIDNNVYAYATTGDTDMQRCFKISIVHNGIPSTTTEDGYKVSCKTVSGASAVYKARTKLMAARSGPIRSLAGKAEGLLKALNKNRGMIEE